MNSFQDRLVWMRSTIVPLVKRLAYGILIQMFLITHQKAYMHLMLYIFVILINWDINPFMKLKHYKAETRKQNVMAPKIRLSVSVAPCSFISAVNLCTNRVNTVLMFFNAEFSKKKKRTFNWYWVRALEYVFVKTCYIWIFHG